MNLVNTRGRNWWCIAYFLLTIASLSFASLLHAQENERIKVGVIVGQESKKSSTSNIEKVCILKSVSNHISSYRDDVEFVFVENERSARRSAQAALELIENNVDIALLPLISKEAEPAADILTAAGLPFITSASGLQVIKDPRYGLSTMPSNLYQAQLLADYYLSHYIGRRIHIVKTLSSRYSIEVANEFSRLVLERKPEVNITTHHFHLGSEKAISSHIEPGDVVFAPLFNPYIAILYHEIASKEVADITILGPDSIGGRTEFYDIIEQVSPHITLRFLKNWDNITKGINSNLLHSYANTYCPFENVSFLTSYSFDLIQLIETNLDKFVALDNKVDIVDIIKQSEYQTTIDGTRMSINGMGYNQKPMYLFEISPQGNILVDQLSR
ncbi:amino acid ABC transporter substrate-binding protein [Vibrio sp. JPW-9-11-11]|uniref:ABC transporter substrate-binding protein n=1 Tax=Vibrio sp. JPW-9-11-11 TaxID=1416532 RepID=UPI001592B562|nr:ABC transporter substrate-binding protein [Vibrio sp. JPW-9-11-11]NVD07155.1 amino acid ABC transporter substrate-binding protein [Vibrio sp. JPW-9-11-11]